MSHSDSTGPTTPVHRVMKLSLALLLVTALLTGCPLADSCPPEASIMFDGLPPEPVARAPYRNQCSEFAGLCTSSFPQAVVRVVAAPGQTITATADPVGFIVAGSDGDGGERVMLQGGASALGNTATELSYSWSSGATDADPCTRAPGAPFSTDPDPEVALRSGVHYIRLTVRNDLPLSPDQLPQELIDRCGDLSQPFRFDFVEVVIDVRD